MSTKLSLIKRVTHYLKSNPGHRYTVQELAEWVMTTYPEACDEKKRNTAANTDDKLLLQLKWEIRSKIGARNYIKTTAERPRRYYYTDLEDQDEVIAAEAQTYNNSNHFSLKDDLSEYELYDEVMKFLKKQLNLDARRIDEKYSTNKRGSKGNKWLYPDIIAIENLSSRWIPEVMECASLHSARITKLWSFEVKRLINRSNVREAYFQAVSNSSWANLGYLISADIVGDDVLEELRMLSALHGIGIMLLNKDSFMDSEIRFPAREKFNIDWLSFNRLAAVNSDTKKVIKSLRRLYLTGEMSESL